MPNGRKTEDHPLERWNDIVTGWRKFPAWAWHHKIYRDVWLFIISGLVLLALMANQDRVDDIQASRVEATLLSCNKYNEIVTASNQIFVLLRGMIVSGAALPGDSIKPGGERDPLKWESIKAGPLSKDIARQFPGFPTAGQRFDQAKQRASMIRENQIDPRNCRAEAVRVNSEKSVFGGN